MTATFPLGTLPNGRPFVVPFNTVLSHAWVTGSTGWGKSGFLLSAMLTLITRFKGTPVVLVDCKGELALELRDRFLPALGGRTADRRRDRIVSVAPFSAYGVPLDPLVPIPGLGTEVQAHLVAGSVGTLVHGGLGPRMEGCLTWLVRGAIEVRGSLLEVRRLILDQGFRRQVASQVRSPDVRAYLLETFESEPPSSRDALRARLDQLLLIPSIRAMLCAGTSVSGADLLEGPVTIVDLGGAPQGEVALARFVGSLVFNLLAAAVFSRKVGPSTAPVLLVCDEWQNLVRGGAAEDFERLLSEARFKKVALWLANQTAGQVREVSPALVESLETNCGVQVLFRPDPEALRPIESLLPLSGCRVDPSRPDRLLTTSEERALLLAELSKLPRRHALLVDRISGKANLMRTLSLPYEEARKRAEALPGELVLGFLRGRFGVAQEELIRRSAGQRSLPSAHPVSADQEGQVAQSSHRVRRLRLVVPT